MNISFSVLSPPLIRHASHSPSFAPDAESQVRSSPTPLHGVPTLPAAHATGVHRLMALCGVFERRVTVSGSGDPSAATPLLYSEQ
jgi:hypothetical protein